MDDFIVITVHTRNYRFEGVGRTEEEAKAALIAAWKRHSRGSEASPALMREMLSEGEGNVSRFQVGKAYRDGSQL